MAGFVTFSMNNIKRQTKYFKVMLNNLDGGHKIQYEIEIVVNEVKLIINKKNGRNGILGFL